MCVLAILVDCCSFLQAIVGQVLAGKAEAGHGREGICQIHQLPGYPVYQTTQETRCKLFVCTHCTYYCFVVHNFQTEVKQNAEVAAYFSKFEEAEKTYLEMDRRYM